MLEYDPAKRITAQEALEHPFFEESPRPQHPSMMPTFPSRAEGATYVYLSCLGRRRMLTTVQKEKAHV